MLTVCNRRNRRGTVYAGRPGPFGNPFVIGKDGNRTEVIAKFRKFFLSASGIPMRDAASQLPDDAVLECFCAPLACHAQVIADYENARRGFTH